ncbi:hypothetical protein TMatcc_000643 [Talaromyces marneffei ATCC 18224]
MVSSTTLDVVARVRKKSNDRQRQKATQIRVTGVFGACTRSKVGNFSINISENLWSVQLFTYAFE